MKIRLLAFAAAAAGMAVLMWFVVSGAPLRIEWQRAVVVAGARQLLSVDLKPSLGASMVYWNAGQLAKWQQAPGVDSVGWRSSLETVVRAGSGEASSVRWVSRGYVRMGLLEPVARLPVDTPSAPAMWISQSRAIERYGSAEAALGREEPRYGRIFRIVGVYRGEGADHLVFDPHRAAAYEERRFFVEDFLVKTTRPAKAARAALIRWAEENEALPPGYQIVPYEDRLRPDYAHRQKAFLRELLYLGTLSIYATALVSVMACSMALVLVQFTRTRELILKRVWGATRLHLVWESTKKDIVPLSLALLTGGAAGSLAAVAAGGFLDGVAVRTGILAALAIVALVLAPVAWRGFSWVTMRALEASTAGLRAPLLAFLAALSIISAIATAVFGVGVVQAGREKLDREIQALGAGIFTLIPKVGDLGARKRLTEEDLIFLRSHYPDIPVALVSNVEGAVLVSADGGREPVRLRVSAGDFWGVVRQTFVEGDASGLVVTPERSGLLGTIVEIKESPMSSDVRRLIVSGIVEAVPGNLTNTPRLQSGWVWLNASGPGLRPRSYFAAIMSLVGVDDLRAGEVARRLSERYPDYRPWMAISAAGYAREYLTQLNRAAKKAAREGAGLVVLAAMGLSGFVWLMLSAWSWEFALRYAFGGSRPALLWRAALLGVRFAVAPYLLGGALGLLALAWWGVRAGEAAVPPWGAIALGLFWAAALGFAAGLYQAVRALAERPARTLSRGG